MCLLRVSCLYPRFVPLGFGILLRNPRGLHWLLSGLYKGHIGKTFQGYDVRGTIKEPLRLYSNICSTWPLNVRETQPHLVHCASSIVLRNHRCLAKHTIPLIEGTAMPQQDFQFL